MAHTLAAGHANRAIPHGHAYARREPEKTALYQVFHRHLPGFERMWSDADSGNCLPRHVTEELWKFLTCGILSHGFAQMHCDACHKRHLVAFSCKGRGFCPSCLGRRMNEGAANLVDHVLPEQVPIRQWVLTLLYPLRYPMGGRLYIPWYELLRRTFGEEVVCPDCGGKLRLIALVKKEETIQALLKARHLPTQATGPPERAQPEPVATEPLELEWSGEGESADWPEYPD